MPSFYFKVSISNVGDISCSEVSGLETEFEEITYRAGDSPVFTKLRMPLTCWKKISRSKSMESLEGNHSIFRYDNFIGCFSADKIKMSVRK